LNGAGTRGETQCDRGGERHPHNCV
jgi:hypothetical protein